MYWYIYILSILVIGVMIYKTLQLKEGFETGYAPYVSNTLNPIAVILGSNVPATISNPVVSPGPNLPPTMAMYSTAFDTANVFPDPLPRVNAAETLISDIAFCKKTVIDNKSDPGKSFSDPTFASSCGICMTQGTLLLDQNVYNKMTNPGGFGVVVYQADKDFAKQQGIQAYPSAQAAYCDTLDVDVSVNPNVSGLVTSAAQYAATKEYLAKSKFNSYSDLANSNGQISQNVSCGPFETIDKMQFTYGHFNDSTSEKGYPLVRNTISSPDPIFAGCLGQNSCTFAPSLPVGQRQWTLDASCKDTPEEIVPPGLPALVKVQLASKYYPSPNIVHYWPTTKNNIKSFIVYKSYDSPEATDVTMEFMTASDLKVYIHNANVYSRGTTGWAGVIPIIGKQTMYPGKNTIKLVLRCLQGADSIGLYFAMKDSTGKVLTTADTTWVWSSTAQDVTGNNGNVSCDTYCQGNNGGPWGGELPVSWNGAKCIGSPSDPNLPCKTAKGAPQICTCEKTGTGWSTAPIPPPPPPPPPPPAPSPTPSKTLRVIDASYGKNCGVSAGYLTDYFQNKVAGLDKFSFSARFNDIKGDPAYLCPKDFEITYDCRDGNTQYVKIAGKEQENYTLNIKCDTSGSPPPPGTAGGPPLPPPPPPAAVPTQVTYGNNGTVTCDAYCAGNPWDGAWNKELPSDWNGAKCVGTSKPAVGCGLVAGSDIACTCEKTGAGWAKGVSIPTQDVNGNNGTVSCATYCGGVGGGPWNGELPVNWNGASCVSTPNNPSVGCGNAAGYPITCRCTPTGKGWNTGGVGPPPPPPPAPPAPVTTSFTLVGPGSATIPAGRAFGVEARGTFANPSGGVWTINGARLGCTTPNCGMMAPDSGVADVVYSNGGHSARLTIPVR